MKKKKTKTKTKASKKVNQVKKSKEVVNKCCCCGSSNVDHITRVTGYFSKDSMWNKGKIAELRDREREVNKRHFKA